MPWLLPVGVGEKKMTYYTTKRLMPLVTELSESEAREFVKQEKKPRSKAWKRMILTAKKINIGGCQPVDDKPCVCKDRVKLICACSICQKCGRRVK